jgi:hypothetical protein
MPTANSGADNSERQRMTAGAGKYDAVTTKVREETQAEGIILVIFGGNKGDGFSVQATSDILLDLPKMLRSIADQIAADLGNGGPPN